MFVLHANNPRAAQNHEIRSINTSSRGKTVIVKNWETFSINFCMRMTTSVKLTNLRFSHGNRSALFSVILDHGKWMGTYYAPPGKGFENFQDTGEFPNNYDFDSGWHVLKINISDESSPLALDFIEFNITDQWMTPEILTCETICIPTAHFPSKQPELTMFTSSATMRQESKPTKCAEIDNVDVPLYHPNIRKFTITSSLPKYKSFSNRRDFNLTNCPHLSPELWRFGNFRISERSDQMTGKNVFLMTAPGNGMMGNSVVLVAIFRLEGQSKGSIDSKIGSELYLEFKSLPSKVEVAMRYRGDSGRIVEMERKTYNGNVLKHTWEIPDFTWTENEDNYIVFSIESDVRINFEVDNVRLVKRPMLPERTETIYSSDDVVIEAVFVEMWWLAPDSMKVRLSNGKVTENVAYMRFYRPIPWNDGYAQVFVMYHDGNIRLLPVAPEGLDWIPFGTSVILGQTLSNSIRPYLYINEVYIDPESWEMKLHYKDGGSLMLKLDSTYSETTAIVSDINFAMDTFTRPFATIRSMYVVEGNTDVDSIKVDNSRSYSIMDRWGEVQGKSFVFFRRCISKHLTLSPDIQVDIVETANSPRGSARRSFTREVFRIPNGNLNRNLIQLRGSNSNRRGNSRNPSRGTTNLVTVNGREIPRDIARWLR
ncbi:hypothetical protein FSP39_000147 [Pinctada imbricata]|uniref:Uncharacterized protein n=1 Tax=Pinctada imbricata TaxID=66713 RepID=A0AA88YD33_PINIB|nr:hypothetical protein FSP39_000147 [Pinctada imbricata]